MRHEMADDWDILKVTIGASGTATPAHQFCLECTMFQSVGTGATVKSTGKTATLALPTTLAGSFSLPKINDLALLNFAGAENSEITIVYTTKK